MSSISLPASSLIAHNAVCGHPERYCFHALFANRRLLVQPSIASRPVPLDLTLTHDNASLSWVTNEEKRGTVTLLQSTEEAVEQAEISADARDYMVASRAET